MICQREGILVPWFGASALQSSVAAQVEQACLHLKDRSVRKRTNHTTQRIRLPACRSIVRDACRVFTELTGMVAHIPSPTQWSTTNALTPHRHFALQTVAKLCAKLARPAIHLSLRSASRLPA